MSRALSHHAVAQTYGLLSKAQIPHCSSRHVSTRLDTLDVSSESRRACRAVLFQHDGRRTSYACLYKFSRLYALTYTSPICSVK